MVDVCSFKALRFNTEITGCPDAVLTPPYDVIDAEARERLGASGPFNMTHLMLPKAQGGRNAYDTAAALLKQWRESGALVCDDTPGIYLLRQKFLDDTGMMRIRKVFFALIRIPEADEKSILGHERTFDKPVEDRLMLTRAVKANLEPIFVMYSDPDQTLTTDLFRVMDAEAPLFAARTSDGVVQELWRSDYPDALQAHLKDQVLYIADGHHRFKTACTYRDEQRAAAGDTGFTGKAYDFVLAGFVAFEDPGLCIFPTHRYLPADFTFGDDELLEKLKTWFDCDRLADEDAPEKALALNPGACRFVLYAGKKKAWLLTLKEDKREALVGTDRHAAWRDLDVAVLHRGIFSHILHLPDSVPYGYGQHAEAVIKEVDEGKASVAFLLRATLSRQVRACAEAFEPMPQKTTFYFPKLPSGAVLNPLE
ncbi:MAG TPA: DUF1015 domain-containing protein [Candidatus Hydrogenedentes bacterium]|jgi:uncharacterized protein (DUF1015 family)|nr:DUF1015 domain-containing protein [Candidatus Hydrogenedentota bacterium]